MMIDTSDYKVTELEIILGITHTSLTLDLSRGEVGSKYRSLQFLSYTGLVVAPGICVLHIYFLQNIQLLVQGC